MNSPDLYAISPDVLVAARSGDRGAQAALYEHYGPMIFTLARRLLGSTALAEDVLQDTFVQLIRRADSCRDSAALGAWLKSVAINRSLSELRSVWWSRRVDVDDAEALVAVGSVQQTQTEIEITRMLDGLPDTARAIVWLHDAEGYTHSEIARLMGRSVSFSKSQLARAHARLRKEFEASEFEDVGTICTTIVKTI